MNYALRCRVLRESYGYLSFNQLTLTKKNVKFGLHVESNFS